MAFLSGKVSFARFKVSGGGPKRLDDQLLDKLRGHAIGTHKFVRSDNEEVGWLGGRHLLDRDFDLEKNVLLDFLHFGLRLDAGKIPPDLLKAYVAQELESLLKENGQSNPRALGRIKKQAGEAAKRRAEREIKDGRYLRMRQFPMLLDTREDLLFSAATQPAILERLYPLFKETFGKRLEPLTAGQLAIDWAEKHSAIRKMEGLVPAQFVSHPEGDTPVEVYWTANDPTSRDFLGNEFLLWLWYTLSEDSDTIALPDKTDAAVVIVRQLTLECPWAENGKEVISHEGPTRLPESRRAIRTGKLPRKVGLIVSRQQEQYEFTLQAETFNISGAALPKIESDGDPRVWKEERVEQVRHLSLTVDLLYHAFLQLRTSSDWPKTLEKMQKWLKED